MAAHLSVVYILGFKEPLELEVLKEVKEPPRLEDRLWLVSGFSSRLSSVGGL